MSHSLLSTLLTRGDKLSIDNGRLIITPASGQAIPRSFLEQNEKKLITAICSLMAVPAYSYVSYSTGSYGKSKSDGLTLQFANTLTGEMAYACFNASLKRIRTTRTGKKGAALPKGHFIVGERSFFYKLWIKAALPLPPSRSRFHDRMGNLKPVIFTAITRESERLDKQSITPVSISCDAINLAIRPSTSTPNTRLTHAQVTPKPRLTVTPKETLQLPTNSDLQKDQTTCHTNHGNTAIRECGYKGEVVTPLTLDPKKQSESEWLNDYTS